MIKKHQLVNTLFLLGFPVYGLGTYFMFLPSFSWSSGLFFTTIPFLAIILFYLMDLVYRGGFTPVINGTFWLCTGVVMYSALSLLVGLHYHSPVLKPTNAAAMAVEFTTPFFAAVIVNVYNRHRDGFDWGGMVMKGLLLLEAVNVVGMAMGLRNKLHSFEGRASFPFVLGLYEAAHLLAIVNLMLLFYFRDPAKKPWRFIGTLILFMVNMAIILSVNSRLSFMIFFVLLVLFVTKAIKVVRGLYTISLFTMPLMMSFALLIYEILSLPFFVAILSRVDKQDVTTFNGRTYIWESVYKWAVHDQRGIIFGNGFNGQYRFRLVEHVAKLWGEPASYRLHMHSAFLEFSVNQGIVGILLLYMVYWRGYKGYREQYMSGTSMAPLFAGFCYLLFVWQIDICGYGYYIGFLLLMFFMAPMCIRPEAVTGKRKALNGEWMP